MNKEPMKGYGKRRSEKNSCLMQIKEMKRNVQMFIQVNYNEKPAGSIPHTHAQIHKPHVMDLIIYTQTDKPHAMDLRCKRLRN